MMTGTQEEPSTLTTKRSRHVSVSSNRSRSSSITALSASNRTFCRQSSIISNNSILEDQGTSETANPSITSERTSFLTSKVQLLVLVCMSVLYFVSTCAFAMIAPFFAPEAASKGSNGTITGLIFAIYPLIVFLISPLVGKFIPLIGVKFTLVAGTFLESGSLILFGFVDLMPSGTVFITFCFLIRGVTALGTAMSSTAILSVVSVTFKDNLATVYGVLELFSGLGFMAGPAIGGGLYGLGDFKLPFIVLGSLVLVVLIFISIFLPGDEAYADKEDDEGNRTGSLIQCIKIPGVTCIAIVCSCGGMVLSFLDPTLTLHLENITHNGLSHEQVGLIFLIPSVIYTVTAPIVGRLADKKIRPRYLIIIGHFITFVGYFFLGPSPITSRIIPKSLLVTSVALGVIGFGIAPWLVPGIIDMQDCGKRGGLPDNLASKTLLSGIFNATFFIGGVIGPTLGGSLVEIINFPWASTIFSFVLVVEGLLLIGFTVWEKLHYRGSDLTVTVPDDEEALIQA